MSGSDSSRRGSLPDVPFLPAGTGMTMTRSCGARKGAWLCGARVISTNICDGCAKAKAERAARVAKVA